MTFLQHSFSPEDGDSQSAHGAVEDAGVDQELEREAGRQSRA